MDDCFERIQQTQSCSRGSDVMTIYKLHLAAVHKLPHYYMNYKETFLFSGWAH